MDSTFKLDLAIQQTVEAYALDAVDFLRQNFRITLDWTDDSVRHIEMVLGVFHDQTAAARPPKEKIYTFAKMFGSYVGEVFRRNHGADWGMVTLGADSFPGMRAHASGATFWPWGRALDRMLNGPEDNVWHYNQLFVQPTGGPERPREQPTARKPFWKKLFGA